MKTTRRPALLTLLLLAGQLPRAARAADGRIPIALAPYTISVPGHYYLTKDLAPASGAAVTINADNVVLDLGDHLITAAAGSYGVYSLNHTDLTVRNGRITGGNYGVALVVSLASPVNPHYRVEDLEVTAATAAGIYLYGIAGNHLRAEIIGNRVAKTAGDGITAQYLDYSRIENNGSREATAGGSGGGSCISLAVITGSLVSGNLASQCQLDGLALFQGARNRVEDNQASGAGGVGVRVYSGANANTVRGNSASGNGAGIEVTGNGNLVDDNTATANGGTGINLSGNSNGYAGNHTMNNGTNGVANSGSGNFNGGGNY